MEALLCFSPQWHNIALQIKRTLSISHDVHLWHTIGPLALNDTLPPLYHPDIAIFVAGAEELASLAGHTVKAAGTNLLLELGFALGRIGAERIAIIHIHLGDRPTDCHHHIAGVENFDCVGAKISRIRSGLLQWIARRDSFSSLDAAHRRVHAIKAKIRNKHLSWMPYINKHVIDPFNTQISDLDVGEIALDRTGYYAAIIGEMGRANRGSSITAIASLSHKFWKENYDQNRYVDQNISAAGRGVNIERVFITSSQEDLNFFTPFARQMNDNGVSIRIVKPGVYGEGNLIPDDIVIFKDADGLRRAYIIIPGDDDRSILRNAILMLRESKIQQYMAEFTIAWEIGTPP